MPTAPHALGARRGDMWTIEVHDIDGDALLARARLLLAGIDLPPERVLDLLLKAKDLERTGEWELRPDGVWVAPVRLPA